MLIRALSLLCLPFLFLMSGCINEDEPAVEEFVKAHDAVPAFSVAMADGTQFSSTDMSGRRWLLVFFSVGCGDCRDYLPELELFHLNQPDANIVCLSRDDTVREVAEFWAAENLTMPYSVPENRDIYAKFASSGVPRLYLVNESGIVEAAFSDLRLPSTEMLIEFFTADSMKMVRTTVKENAGNRG